MTVARPGECRTTSTVTKTSTRTGPSRRYIRHPDDFEMCLASGTWRWHDLLMDQDDPEKRIADLERQLSDMNPPPTPAADNSWQPAPPAPMPPPPGTWQPAALPPQFNWQPASQSPLNFGSGFTPQRSRSFMWIGVVIALAVIVPVIIAVFSIGNTISSQLGGSGSPFSSTKVQLHTVDGLNGMFAKMRSQFGDTTGFRLVIYPEYASLDRPDPSDKRRKKNYDYRGGDFNESIIQTSVDSSDHLADLSKFDEAAVIANFAGAAKAFDFKNPDSQYAIVDGQEDGSLKLSIYVNDHGLSGWMEINPDGSVKESHPPS